MSKAQRDYQRRRQAAGLCVTCGGGPRVTVTRCHACNEAHLARNKARTERLLAAGLCCKCGKRPRGHFRTCRKCRTRAADLKRRRRRRATAYVVMEPVGGGIVPAAATLDPRLAQDASAGIPGSWVATVRYLARRIRASKRKKV